MHTPPTGPSSLRRTAGMVLAVNLVAGLAAVIYGVVELSSRNSAAGPAVGLAFLGGGLLAVLIGALLYSQVLLLHKFVTYTYRAYEALLTSAELQRRQEELLRTVADNSRLSEWAKRVVHREKDYEFLRDTIHGAIIRQDWEAAEHLIRDMETEFGYLDDAARFREQLEQARKATTEERIGAIVARFDSLCEQRKWEQAHLECTRLHSLYPDDQRIAALPEEIEERRGEYKQQLLKEYEEAVRVEDVDRAHRLLFDLDQYMAPSEAEAIKESARGVFRARLEQIKTRFSIAVSYKQFPNAIRAGEQLMREFPNSGYAREIAKLMPVLRERVSAQEARSHAEHGASAAEH
jgi:hypothetical protein